MTIPNRGRFQGRNSSATAGSKVRLDVQQDQPLLHRIGAAGARFGTKPPRSRGVRLAIQIGLVVVIFGFLVLTVIDQWSQIQSEGVHFHVGWLLPAIVILPVFFVCSAYGWDLILRFLGYRIGFGRAQVAWGQPMLARYVPGSVLYVLGRVLLSERAGIPRRITIASIVYEQAISATSAIVVASYFIVNHPDLQGQPLRWAVLLAIPAAIVLLHPRVFGPIANRLLAAFGREPLPAVIPLGGVVSLIVYYSLNWVVVAFGIYCVARSVTYIPFDDVLLVGSAQAIGYFAALVTLVAPAGLGVRDAAFAWAMKAALPGKNFGLASLIAIAVRGVLTVAELIYVAGVTALGRREGWSIQTGILHPSPEEEAAEREAERATT
jgi:glycosyltransferase 2 family protein